ncbi:PIH1 domain-containing protein 1 isoform X2 [Patella vulgata]|uniref:PIH1 domain-containing protein 1 isoform X2 n=2 Tax=Patella vulgata TaxID=6465 RepID=UPI00217F6358|nr:PIH1 domain-containing protein 1 isoform X2 [Patella vulgata]
MENLIESESDQAKALLNRLLIESNNGQNMNEAMAGAQSLPKSYTTVVPTPGFCLKTKNKKGEKFFINICKSENVPKPDDLSDDELIKLLESDDPTGFRIPMSIGTPHAELDKGGSGCTAYDVIVNPEFYDKMETSELFRTFFMTVMLEGVESKYDQELSRNWVILKNKKFAGDLAEQYVRNKSNSLITEMDDSQHKKKIIEEIQHNTIERKRAPEPKFTILQEPTTGHPDFLVAEIHLPQVKTSQTLSLDVGEDRIVLETRSNVYDLDIYLPFNIEQDECGAQFDRKTKILTITMPVQPLN